MTTTYHLDGDKVTYEKSNGTDTIYYTRDIGMYLLSMNLNGREYYYVYNYQGDVIGLIDKPGWGRFINTDSLAVETEEILSSTIFAYTKYNPVNAIDPSDNIPIMYSHLGKIVTEDPSEYNQYIVARIAGTDTIINQLKVDKSGMSYKDLGLETNNTSFQKVNMSASSFDKNLTVGKKSIGRSIQADLIDTGFKVKQYSILVSGNLSGINGEMFVKYENKNIKAGGMISAVEYSGDITFKLLFVKARCGGSDSLGSLGLEISVGENGAGIKGGLGPFGLGGFCQIN